MKQLGRVYPNLTRGRKTFKRVHATFHNFPKKLMRWVTIWRGYLGSCSDNAMVMHQEMEGRDMNAILYTFLLSCSILLVGCSHPRQIAEDLAGEKEPPEMIQIQNLALTDKTLTLDYRVSNPFDDDIQVCQDINPQGTQHAATGIDGEYVFIKLRLYREHEKAPSRHVDPPGGFGEYLQLPPGESYAGRILLDLPIKDGFPDPWEDPKEHEQLALHRAIFEVGYFGPQYSRLFEGISKLSEKSGYRNEIISSTAHYQLPTSVVVVPETQDRGKSRLVAYVRSGWAELRLEESAKVLITDVNIPCSVVVDDN